ncbi:hypothetical protein BV898_10825 [Hypsibius exemplaris]|uniref:Uncharacterized protein n=1 Tax=Hypsibius exemplaris TaxID=2072580 RepID=A0A1W0WIH7_HYPEX|nr:hypothetical protein BV898_10825 [Hypsibius exemplaris]
MTLLQLSDFQLGQPLQLPARTTARISSSDNRSNFQLGQPLRSLGLVPRRAMEKRPQKRKDDSADALSGKRSQTSSHSATHIIPMLRADAAARFANGEPLGRVRAHSPTQDARNFKLFKKTHHEAVSSTATTPPPTHSRTDPVARSTTPLLFEAVPEPDKMSPSKRLVSPSPTQPPRPPPSKKSKRNAAPLEELDEDVIMDTPPRIERKTEKGGKTKTDAVDATAEGSRRMTRKWREKSVEEVEPLPVKRRRK